MLLFWAGDPSQNSLRGNRSLYSVFRNQLMFLRPEFEFVRSGAGLWGPGARRVLVNSHNESRSRKSGLPLPEVYVMESFHDFWKANLRIILTLGRQIDWWLLNYHLQERYSDNYMPEIQSWQEPPYASTRARELGTTHPHLHPSQLLSSTSSLFNNNHPSWLNHSIAVVRD